MAEEKKADKGDQPAKSGDTAAGQEASRGAVPEKHDREHQSNYGGGGANGGTQKS